MIAWLSGEPSSVSCRVMTPITQLMLLGSPMLSIQVSRTTSGLRAMMPRRGRCRLSRSSAAK